MNVPLLLIILNGIEQNVSLWKIFSVDLLSQFDRQNDKPMKDWVTQMI